MRRRHQRAPDMGTPEKVGLLFVSHSAAIAAGLVELARQMATTAALVAAGGTDDGRIGTSLDKVMAALEQAAGDGVVVLADLGSAVMTAESAAEFAAEPGSVLIADAPLVEGLVAAAVAAQAGAEAAAVKDAAEAVYRPPPIPRRRGMCTSSRRTPPGTLNSSTRPACMPGRQRRSPEACPPWTPR